MFAFLLVIMSVVNLSMCVFACLCLSASVCLRMPFYLSIYLSICLSAVGLGRSVVGLSQLSVSHGVHEACRQRRGRMLRARVEGYTHKSERLG